MAQILIIDPSCVDGSGHHVRSIIDLCAAVSPIEPHVVLNAATSPDLFAPRIPCHFGLKATVYEDSQFGARPDDRFSRRIWKLRRTLAKFVSIGSANDARKWPELESILRALPMRPDHIVLPSADVALIAEVLAARAANPSWSHTQVHARLISVENNFARLAQAKAKFDADAASSNLHLYVEMPAMARHLKTEVGLHADLFPYLLAPPVEAYAKPPRCEAAAAAPMVFGFVGGARNEKGFYRLPAILQELTTTPGYDRTRASFLIQSTGRTVQADQAIAEVIKTINALDVSATFIDGVLDDAGYAHMMRQIDVLLLPYQGQRYKLSGSGILNEAIVSAKPVIATAGLSFGEYLQAGNGIEATNDAGFAAGIVAITRDPEQFRAHASRQAADYLAGLKSQALIARLRHPILPPAQALNAHPVDSGE